jgi:hypothetical protein
MAVSSKSSRVVLLRQLALVLLLLLIRYIWNKELADGRNLRMGSSEIESALKKLGKRHALTEPEFKELMWGVYEKVPF